MSHPNRMQACRRSKVPAIPPPTAIANRALLFPDGRGAESPLIRDPFFNSEALLTSSAQFSLQGIDKGRLAVFSGRAGGTMAEVGLLPFARVALQVATQVLPPYRTRFSKQQFTQPPLLAVLCLITPRCIVFCGGWRTTPSIADCTKRCVGCAAAGVGRFLPPSTARGSPTLPSAPSSSAVWSSMRTGPSLVVLG